MMEQLTDSVRRLARGAVAGTGRMSAPLVRVGDLPAEAVVVAQGDIAMLRGVTAAAADQADCTCPEHCERDHANE